jgi:transposase-like protein
MSYGSSLPVAIDYEVLDGQLCRDFWRKTFCPEGAVCPRCHVSLSDQQQLTWRDGGKVHCRSCGKWFTWRTGTPFANMVTDERQLYLLAAMRSSSKYSTAEIAAACGMSADTVRAWIRRLA